MNENTEQDVVVPLNSVDTEIKKSHAKLNQTFKDFWEEKDAEERPTETPKPVEAHVPPDNSEIVAERDRLRAENERLKIIEREQDVTTDPDFYKTYTAPVVDTYRSTLEEMAANFDGTPEEIQSQFLDPAWQEWTPATLQNADPTWLDKQLTAARKASPIVREKIRQKFAEAVRLQKVREDAIREWQKPENAQARRQYREQEEQRRTTSDLVLREIGKAINEPEFAYYGNLTKRAESGDTQAKAEVAAINRDFPGWIDLQLRLGEPPGTAVRNALRKLPKKGGLTQIKAAAMSGSQEALGRKPLPRDSAKSLRDAFSQNWDIKGKPPIRYNSLTSKYE